MLHLDWAKFIATVYIDCFIYDLISLKYLRLSQQMRQNETHFRIYLYKVISRWNKS